VASKPIYNVSKKYEAILDAGEALLCEGLEKAQPLSITKKAGVSVGLFYRYFDNKHALLTAVMERRLETLHTQITQDVEPIDDARQALECVLVSTLNYFREHQGLIKLFFMEIGYGDVQAMQQLKAPRDTYRKIITLIIKKGIKQGSFRDQKDLDIEIAVNAIVGTINWSLYDLLVVQGKHIEPKKLTQRILTFLLQGLISNKARS